MRYILSLIILIAFLGARAYAQDEISANEKVILSALDEFIKPNSSASSIIFDFKKSDYENPRVKNRLIQLLSNKWNDNDYKYWFDYYIDNNYKERVIIPTANKIAEKKQKKYEDILDSLINSEKNIILKRIQIRKVDNYLILLAGWLDLKEVIPVLKVAYTDTSHYDQLVVELCLARLQEKPYYERSIKMYTSKKRTGDCSYVYDSSPCYKYNARKLLFIATEEAVLYLREWLDKNTVISSPSDSDDKIYLAGYAVLDLYNIIENRSFRGYFGSTIPFMAIDVKIEDIKFVRDWISSKKERISINRNWIGNVDDLLP